MVGLVQILDNKKPRCEISLIVVFYSIECDEYSAEWRKEYFDEEVCP